MRGGGEAPTRALARASLPRLRGGVMGAVASTNSPRLRGRVGVGLRRLCRGLFLLFGLFLGFALAAADRGAEDVAEAGAGFGGTELGHRPLLLIDLARLDRQRDAPGGAVDRRDLGVDPLADREAVRALLAAVARQLGFTDEAGH